jgi:putative endonuclease
MNDRKERGDWGEERAAVYLRLHGYRILERNFRCRQGEIDIIARRGDVVAFVEVKQRKNADYGEAREFVTFSKQRRIIRAAYAYCERRNIDEEQWYIRYDIASVEIWQGEILSIDYLENAFDESDYSL